MNTTTANPEINLKLGRQLLTGVITGIYANDHYLEQSYKDFVYYVGEQKPKEIVIDFDHEPIFPTAGSVLETRMGIKSKTEFKPSDWSAFNPTEKDEDENYVDGYEFKLRLNKQKRVVPNSNMNYLLLFQLCPQVQEFLDKFEDKTLLSFGDVFKHPKRNFQYVTGIEKKATLWMPTYILLSENFSADKHLALVFKR